MPRPVRVSVFLIVFGIVVAALPGQFLYSKKKIENDGINVEARVEKHQLALNESRFNIALRFTTRTGVMVTDSFETTDDYWVNIKNGGLIKVRYSRINPREYYVFDIKDHNYVFVIIGALMLLGGIITFIIYLKEYLWERFELHELE